MRIGFTKKHLIPIAIILIIMICSIPTHIEKFYCSQMLEALMKKGANPYAKADNGKCAMDYLREKSPEDAEKLIELAKKYGYEE